MRKVFLFFTIGLIISCTHKEKEDTLSIDSTDGEFIEKSAKEQENMLSQIDTSQNVPPIVYYNERYGFSIKYPSSFGQYKESDNGDGMTAYTQNGSMVIKASASYNIYDEDDIYSIMEKYKSWIIDEGGSISYQYAKGKTIVLSGHTKGGLIFYEKAVLYTSSVYGDECECIATVYYEYPESEKDAGDEAIALIGNFPKN